MFLLQTVPPLCAANHHDNLSGLLLKIQHRSIKNLKKKKEVGTEIKIKTFNPSAEEKRIN